MLSLKPEIKYVVNAPINLVRTRCSHQGLLQALRLRANDAAQTRPEYGLANNAAFLMAPSALGLNTRSQFYARLSRARRPRPEVYSNC